MSKKTAASKPKVKAKADKVEVATPGAMPAVEGFAPVAVAEDRIISVPIAEIVSNSQNPRESASNAIQMGYGIWAAQEGSSKQPLVALALGKVNDPANFPTQESQRAEFVKIMEKMEPEIVGLATNIKSLGQLQGTMVRILPTGYDLVFGCRRVLASLYLFCKEGLVINAERKAVPGDVPTIGTIISDTATDNDKAMFIAFSENANRMQMGPMEQARWFGRLKLAGLKNKEIMEKTKIDEQVVRQRLQLLELPKDLQTKVENSELGVVKALEIVKGKADAKNPASTGKGRTGDGTRRKVPSVAEFQQMYESDDTLHEEVRKWIATRIIDVKYLTFAALAKEKEKADKAGKAPAKSKAA